jgi:hypothetical protein
MIEFSDWFPLATVGLMFTILGSLKLWGLSQGIVGGADKQVMFLGIGLGELGWLAWLLCSRLSGR